MSDLAFRPIPEPLAHYLCAVTSDRPVAAGIELDGKLTQAQLAARRGPCGSWWPGRWVISLTLASLCESVGAS